MKNYFLKLNEKWLFVPKAIYLIVNLQFYGFHKLRSAFAKEKFNISTEEYGKFTGYTQFITFFTGIIIGNITDKTKKYHSSLFMMIALSTFVFLFFYINSITSLHPSVFWIILLFYCILNNPKQPLLDKIMIEYLDKNSEIGSKIYGKQRLWGTFALPMATYISEWCIKTGGDSSNFNNLIHYNVLATILALITAVFFFYSIKRSDQEQNLQNTQSQRPESQNSNRTRIRGTFVELLTNSEFMFFFLIIFLNSISRSALTIYLELFHSEILQISPRPVPENWNSILRTVLRHLYNNPVSTIATAGVVFEVIILFSSDYILVALGHFLPLILAQIISLVRFFAYYLISPSNPYVFELSCGIELLRGVYFGLIHVSSVYIATKMAPPHLRTTSQMIYQGTFGALGFLISGQIFGGMFQSKLEQELAAEEKTSIYRQIFLINIIISSISIGACMIKYGLFDRVLFNKEAEKKKLSKYDEIPEEITIK